MKIAPTVFAIAGTLLLGADGAIAAADHANSPDIAIQDLRAFPLVLPTRKLNPGLHDAIIGAFHDANCEPKVGQFAPQLVASIPMVAAGFGIAIVPASLSRLNLEGVVYVPLKDVLLRAQIDLAYRRGESSTAVKNLVAITKRVVSQGATPTQAQ